MPYSIDKDRCIGCSGCAGHCPTSAIKGEFKDYFYIVPELCIDCGVCGMICPEEAVLDAQGNTCERIPRHLRPLPSVDEDLCNGCDDCTYFCPFSCRGSTDARTFQGISLLTRPELCRRCMECMRICGNRAITF